MPNVLDANGLQVETYDELVAYFTAKYREIYGADISLESNTPDGQMMRIYVQAITDRNDLMVQVFNMQDPDNAMGRILDQRCAINGIQRKGGSFTVTNVTLVTSQSINFYGLDQTAQDVFTVADSAGNEWQLMTTVLGVAPGTHILAFRARVPGAQLTVPNTITVPVTIILGVTSINNPTTYTSLGVNEESDPVLKTRRQRSVALPAQGYLPALEAALANINGVTFARVYENDTDSTDGDGVPAHSIWVIVAGSAPAADIANAIYVKRNAGAGMFGDTDYGVTQVDGTIFVISWDDVVTQALFIKFTATSLNGTTAPNIAAIRAQLPGVFAPGVNAEVNINALGTAVQGIDPNTLVTSPGFSNGETQNLDLTGVPASGAFVVRYNGNNSASIAWNDSIGTIQTKIQAIPGLAAAVVTGSLASQTLVCNLSGVGGVQGLLTVPTNTLQTSAPAAIAISLNAFYANTLSPDTKRNQFSVTSPNIIIGLKLLPATSTAVDGETIQFTGLGGYGSLTYVFLTNSSGGTIDAGTGLYTAGATPGTDTIRVRDELGSTADATVVVS